MPKTQIILVDNILTIHRDGMQRNQSFDSPPTQSQLDQLAGFIDCFHSTISELREEIKEWEEVYYAAGN